MARTAAIQADHESLSRSLQRHWARLVKESNTLLVAIIQIHRYLISPWLGASLPFLNRVARPML